MRHILKILSALAVAFFILSGQKTDIPQAQLDRIEAAAKRAALQCYALEGAYPEDIQYLHDHYGLAHDKNVMLYYTFIGRNLPPQIAAVVKEA